MLNLVLGSLLALLSVVGGVLIILHTVRLIEEQKSKD